MTPRGYFVSALCGLAWHGIATLLLFYPSGQLLPGAAASVLTGILAGGLTIRSRRLRDGRESWLDLGLTYFAAFTVYAVGLAFTEYVVDGILGGSTIDLSNRLVLYVGYSWYFAAVWGIVFVPLCFCTRRLVWWAHARRMRPQDA